MVIALTVVPMLASRLLAIPHSSGRSHFLNSLQEIIGAFFLGALARCAPTREIGKSQKIIVFQKKIGEAVQTAVGGSVPTRLQLRLRLVDIRMQLRSATLTSMVVQLEQVPLIGRRKSIFKIKRYCRGSLWDSPCRNSTPQPAPS